MKKIFKTSKRRIEKKHLIIGIILFAIYLGSALVTIDDYGFTWDILYEHLNGQVIMQYYINPSSADSVRTMLEHNFYMPPKFASIIMTLSYRWFTENGTIPGNISFDVPIIILGSLTLLLTYFFMLKEVGFKAALFSSLSFMIYPRLFEHIHNNMKDPIAMMVTLLFYFMFFKYFQTRKLKFAILTAISTALLLHTKIYTVFAFLTVLIWLAWNWKDTKSLFTSRNTLYHAIIGIMIFIVLINFLAPIYWKEFLFLKVFKVTTILRHPTLYMGQVYTNGPPLNYAIIMMIITTPLAILGATIYGFQQILKNLDKNKPFYTLLILALFIPIIKYPILNLTIYNGTRQLMDSFPFMFMIAGIGFALAYDHIRKFLRSKIYNQTLAKYATIIIFACMFIVPLIMIIQLHPHQKIYFNPLVGGVKGAQDKFEMEYWGSSYKQGSEWINENLPPGSAVMVPIAYHLPEKYLDKDIILITEEELDLLKNYEKYYVMTIRSGYYAADRSGIWTPWLKGMTIIHQVKVKNVPLLDIYEVTHVKRLE